MGPPADVCQAIVGRDREQAELAAALAGARAGHGQLECHWAMADLAISLDDQAAATLLAAQLLPYEKLWAVDGIGGAVFGPVAEQLGRLAACLRRPDEAGRHLAVARERYEQAGTPALLARLSALSAAATSRREPRAGGSDDASPELTPS